MKKVLLCIVFLCLLQPDKLFCQVIPKDIVERVNKSPFIFEGEVIGVNSYWNVAHDYIYTSVTVDIKKIFKGDLVCGTVELILLGGQVGDRFLEISHNLTLSRGEKGVFLCQETDCEESAVDYYHETNSVALQPTYNEQGFIRYYFDKVNPEVIDYWQFRLDSIAKVYDLMELYTQLHFVDCNVQPVIASSNPIDTSLFHSLENPQVTDSAGKKYFEFDVALSDNQSNVYFQSTNIYIEYDTLTFEAYINQNNKLTFDRGTVTQDVASYTINIADHDAHTITLHIFSLPPFISLNYVDLPSTPENAVHIKLEIKDCNHSSALNILSTPVNSFFAYGAANNLPHQYYTQNTYGSINFISCDSMYISSISPNPVRAGVGDVVTITGKGFGSSRGIGNVFLKNADTGGRTYIHLDSTDYLSNGWSDTQISFTVPSVVDSTAQNKRDACPGSGFVKIITNTGDSINNNHINDSLIIEYGISNRHFTAGKSMVNLAPKDSGDIMTGWSALQFYPDSEVFLRTDLMNCIRAAIKQWVCLTTVNFKLGAPKETSDTIPVEDGRSRIIFGYSPDSAALITTYQWSYYSSGSCQKGFTNEADIVINNLYDTLFYADTSKSNPVPPGKFDFYQLILHELGHAHSLTHVNDTNSVMWYGTTKSGMPAGNRRITLINDQVAVNGGNYVTSNAYLIDTVQCPVIRMGVGSTNCTAIGIGEIDPNIYLNLYPNPASDKLYISYNLEKQSTITITIFDLQGRQIYIDLSKQSSLNGIKEIPIQTLNNGYYLIRINIGQSSYVIKLIKR